MINNKQRRKEAKEMKTELFLREKDDQSLLVVVDMINGFIHTGALADSKIDQITPAVLDTVSLPSVTVTMKTPWNFPAFRRIA